MLNLIIWSTLFVASKYMLIIMNNPPCSASMAQDTFRFLWWIDPGGFEMVSPQWCPVAYSQQPARDNEVWNWRACGDLAWALQTSEELSPSTQLPSSAHCSSPRHVFMMFWKMFPAKLKYVLLSLASSQIARVKLTGNLLSSVP